MENQILILFARPYDLTDENTGERKTGVSIHYVDSTSSFNDSQNGYGSPIFKSSLPPEALEEIKVIPGVYSPTFSTYISKGQRCSKLTSAKLLKEFVLFK